MDGVASDCGAFEESVAFLSYFKYLPGHRQGEKVICPLDEILLLCLLAVLSKAHTFIDIALFGVEKLVFLRRFRPFKDGPPSHDHLGDIMASLDAEAFQRCFVAWVTALTGTADGVIAIDGKTVRRSRNRKKSGKAAIHMVSAFAASQRLVLSQTKVLDKSNEITTITKLLEILAIERAVIIIDAMGFQRDIAQNIIDKKAN